MYYYKELQPNGAIRGFWIYNMAPLKTSDPLFVEISKDEYESLSHERSTDNQPEESDEISAEEALDIILGVST